MKKLNLQLIFLFALLILLQTNNIFGQTRVITGTVFNSVTNEPIPDIKISIKGVNQTDKSDKNGKYSISVPDTMKTISFSEFNAMNVTEVKIISKNNIDIYLSQKDIFDLTLEELMQVEVEIASKKAESIIETPVSTSVISAQEIENSGAVSIPEILRLFPGLIVREKTNGNYDIHIRGNDNPALSAGNTALNTNTLVMIDNRIVYSYFQGGIFWETLPVELTDIERIELIRGPAAALYGPNAVSGVINIITKNAEINKVSVSADMQAGNLNTTLASASVEFAKQKFGIRASGNYTYKERFQEDYYVRPLNRYTSRDSLWHLINSEGEQIIDSATTIGRYPDINKAVDKWGMNISAFYNVNDKINFNLSSGIQKSIAQTLHLERIISASSRTSNTKYINFQSNVYGLNTNISYLTGQQNLFVGRKGLEFDTELIEITSDYNFTFNNLTIRPGVSYRTAMYNDLPYIDITQNEGYIHSKKTINNFAPSIIAEYLFFKKLRFIGAVRMDNYNKPDDNYFAYEFAATFKINKNHLIRTVYSQANSGPFIMDFYKNYNFQIGPGGVATISLFGNENLKLVKMDMFEFGAKSIIAEQIYFDIELFYSKINNFSFLKQTETQTVQVGQNTIVLPKTREQQNIDLNLVQTGISFSFTYVPIKNIQIKTFGTFQKTTAKDYDLNMYNYENNTVDLVDLEHNYTPSFYGGFSINYKPIHKLNVFTNLYYLSQQTYNGYDDETALTDGKLEIEPKYVLNLKVSYQIWKNNSLFVNLRNLTDNKTKEFIFADDTGIMFLAGLNIKI